MSYKSPVWHYGKTHKRDPVAACGFENLGATSGVRARRCKRCVAIVVRKGPASRFYEVEADILEHNAAFERGRIAP